MNVEMLKEGSSPATGTISPTFWKASIQVPSKGEAPSPRATLWSDVDFVTLRLKIFHLPFSNKFTADYQALQSKLVHTIASMKDNLLLSALMFEDIDQEMRVKVEKEITTKLQNYVDAYKESLTMLKFVYKDNETWEKNMTYVKAKDNKISNNNKFLQESLYVPSFTNRSWRQRF